MYSASALSSNYYLLFSQSCTMVVLPRFLLKIKAHLHLAPLPAPLPLHPLMGEKNNIPCCAMIKVTHSTVTKEFSTRRGLCLAKHQVDIITTQNGNKVKQILINSPLKFIEDGEMTDAHIIPISFSPLPV